MALLTTQAGKQFKGKKVEVQSGWRWLFNCWHMRIEVLAGASTFTFWLNFSQTAQMFAGASLRRHLLPWWRSLSARFLTRVVTQWFKAVSKYI